MPHPFLTARWSNLVLVNYQVPRALLEPFVPPGSELDTPDDAPELHLLSLVAFHFSDTRVYGLPLPTAQHFPELNLRFYVRSGDKRATVFLREFVSVPLVALGARLLYHQPYFLATIWHEWRQRGQEIRAYTRFKHRAHRGEIRVVARNEPSTPALDSQEHFLKEHYWGFDRTPSGQRASATAWTTRSGKPSPSNAPRSPWTPARFLVPLGRASTGPLRCTPSSSPMAPPLPSSPPSRCRYWVLDSGY